ncbi:MAG TPA: cysteine--tRNA ligase, partial [Candidatus Thermoplasmatota archaeon]|nr:cysteine--tRNA ligase [Candidatus Thermoplasmatota archaeon]
GPTVYSYAHIGNARPPVVFDVLFRLLRSVYGESHVVYARNYTDIDDKIIAAANKEGVDPLTYAQRFTKRCLDDLDALGVRRADLYPKASETIPDMIEMIKRLVANEYAYIADGDVYFSVEKYQKYGQLSGQNIMEMKSGARIEPGESKQSPLDFALWKHAKPGEPTWESPWGPGRPGWHIECSAMSNKFLGMPFDIHGGGMDLRFPHHENEIAQAEAATGKPFAKYWMHIGLLTIDSEKMSKSLGNIINVRDLLKTWDAEILRMFFAQAHYRSPPDFSEKALSDVEKALERLSRFKERLEQHSLSQSASHSSSDEQYKGTIMRFQETFEQAMDDDFNTPKAFASLFEFVNASNRFFEETTAPSAELCRHALGVYLKAGNVLTLFQPKPKTPKKDDLLVQKLQQLLEPYIKGNIPNTIEALLQHLLHAREDARKRKDWSTADTIRKGLEALEFEIQDTAHGPVWRKK